MTQQPQRLFVITEENLNKLVKNGVSKKSEEIAYLVKQCPYSPAPAPAAQDLFKHYNIADEDMPDKCPMSCIYKRFSQNMRNAEAREATIRNQTIDEIQKGEIPTSYTWRKAESLRPQEPQRGDQR